MATIVANTSDTLEFVNIVNGQKEGMPTLLLQAGHWDSGGFSEAGVVFDVSGDAAPLLSPHDIRKLAKWLFRAADVLDGINGSQKKDKKRHKYEADDSDDY